MLADRVNFIVTRLRVAKFSDYCLTNQDKSNFKKLPNILTLVQISLAANMQQTEGYLLYKTDIKNTVLSLVFGWNPNINFLKVKGR